MISRLKLAQHLYEIAEHQGGFFTARQAREAGYKDNAHAHHVQSGKWIRDRRGIYRLAQFPPPPRPDLMLWQLWSHNRSGEPQGTFSHATALTLHELSDVMPTKLDMTVPPGFQRMAAVPEVLRLHRARLAERDVETVDRIRVTTPLRTLVDVIVEAAIAPDLEAQAVDQAIRRGLVVPRQLADANVSARAGQRIAAVLKQVADGRPTPTQNSRGATRGRLVDTEHSRDVGQSGVRAVTTGGETTSEIKVRRETDRHYLPHNDLERAAQHFRTRIDERFALDDRKGIAFDILAELVFLAFSVEAKVNFLGAKLVPGWRERSPFNEKLNRMLDHLGIRTDWTSRPYSTLETLKNLRDSMAHGKPVHEQKTEELIINTADEEDLFAALRSEWDCYYRGTFYREAHDDVNTIWEQWLAASKLTRFEATTRSAGSTTFLEHVTLEGSQLTKV